MFMATFRVGSNNPSIRFWTLECWSGCVCSDMKTAFHIESALTSSSMARWTGSWKHRCERAQGKEITISPRKMKPSEQCWFPVHAYVRCDRGKTARSLDVRVKEWVGGVVLASPRGTAVTCCQLLRCMMGCSWTWVLVPCSLCSKLLSSVDVHSCILVH